MHSFLLGCFAQHLDFFQILFLLKYQLLKSFLVFGHQKIIDLTVKLISLGAGHSCKYF